MFPLCNSVCPRYICTYCHKSLCFVHAKQHNAPAHVVIEIRDAIYNMIIHKSGQLRVLEGVTTEEFDAGSKRLLGIGIHEEGGLGQGLGELRREDEQSEEIFRKRISKCKGLLEEVWKDFKENKQGSMLDLLDRAEKIVLPQSPAELCEEAEGFIDRSNHMVEEEKKVREKRERPEEKMVELNKEYKEMIEEHKKEMQRLHEEEAKCAETIGEKKKEKEELEAAVHKLEQDITEIKVMINRYKESEKEAYKECAKADKELAAKKNELKELQREAKRIMDKHSEKQEQEIEAFNQEKEKLFHECKNLRKQLAESESRRQAELTAKQQQIKTGPSECDIAAKKETICVGKKLQGLLQKLKEVLKPIRIDNRASKETPADVARKIVDTLKEKIDTLLLSRNAEIQDKLKRQSDKLSAEYKRVETLRIQVAEQNDLAKSKVWVLVETIKRMQIDFSADNSGLSPTEERRKSLKEYAKRVIHDKTLEVFKWKEETKILTNGFNDEIQKEVHGVMESVSKELWKTVRGHRNLIAIKRSQLKPRLRSELPRGPLHDPMLKLTRSYEAKLRAAWEEHKRLALTVLLLHGWAKFIAQHQVHVGS